MKVKLLKKIRKEFSIERIDKLGSGDGEVMEAIADELGLPFYLVSYPDSKYAFYCTNTFATLKEAKERVMQKIMSRYKDKFRGTKRKSTKVWWTNDK